MDHIETPQEVGFPLLGYTTVATLKDIEIQEADLLTLLVSLGMIQYMPGLPKTVTVLQRAVRRWLHEISKADIGIAEDEKILLRKIGGGKGEIIAFGLVVESRDLTEWGLDYLTNLRIFYDEATDSLALRCSSAGQDYQRMTGPDLALLSQIDPHWQYYKKLYTAADLTRMVQDIIADMDAANLKHSSGTYFVPVDKLAELQQMKELIEEKLPSTLGDVHKSSLSAFPMIDRPSTKKQLSNLAYNSLIADIEALEKNLSRFSEQKESTTPKRGKPATVRKETVLERLRQYKAMKAKVMLYNEKMGIRQDELISRLATLEKAARSLVDMDIEEDDPVPVG